jgi:hypothetical protein
MTAVSTKKTLLNLYLAEVWEIYSNNTQQAKPKKFWKS